MTQDGERPVDADGATIQKILVPVDDYMALLGRTLTWIQKTHYPYRDHDADPGSSRSPAICPSCTAIVAARKGREAVPWPCPVMVELGPVYAKAAELVGEDHTATTTNEENATDGQDDES